MITYIWGDLFTSPAQTLVNTVNTVGVMGKGIAKEFKFVYPEMFKVYQEACERGEFTIGKLLLYRSPHKLVLNFPTKRHWRQRSRVQDIETGLKSFVAGYERHGITSVAFPQLGCGNGELGWDSQVRPLMERYLGGLPIDIYIHLYEAGTLLPEHRDRAAMKRWLRSEPRALAFSEVWDDLAEAIHCGEESGRILAGWHLSITSIGNEAAILFQGPHRQVILIREDLFDLWQRLRGFGLLAEHDLPVPVRDVSIPLFELLLTLPYIQQTRFRLHSSVRDETADCASSLQAEEAFGVRLVPPVEEQSSLSRQPLSIGTHAD